jgi:lysyl-tRNA synthetase class 2
MELTEELVCEVLMATHGTLEIPYQGHVLNFSRPWRRKTMAELVNETLQVDVSAMDVSSLEDLARRVHAKLPAQITHGHLVNEIFETSCEASLIQPTFVIDHPLEISPLAKRKLDAPHLTERFEVFVAGRELGNAFSELNDPQDQRERFAAQLAERAAGNDEAHHVDEDYLHALELGLPPTGGLGIGIDRLVMLVVDAASIRDVILFPLLRPREAHGG